MPEAVQAPDQILPDQVPPRPNQYHLQGGGISVSYYPGGAGPLVNGNGRIRFTYQDTVSALIFRDDIHTVEVPDVGTIISVTIVSTIDVGSTTFSLVVPLVVLPGGDLGNPVAIDTVSVTTVHRLFARAVGHPQRASYAVTELRGTASDGFLPL